MHNQDSPNVYHPMERAGALIKRLLEQYESNSDAGNLLLTTQMLLNELREMNQRLVPTEKKVVVILPVSQEFETKHPVNENHHLSTKYPFAPEKVYDEKRTAEKMQPIVEPQIPAPKKKETVEVSTQVFEIPGRNKLEEIPAKSFSKKAGELNDFMAKKEESLNDRLKIEKIELGSVLTESPVKDLKKAIGINDRFVFINELFRGDENMYERSIKTINAFNILAEAEFWIQRELKVKIGWNEDSDTVKHFDHLVRRRFF